ncbi:hypothetical protein [Telluria beijingensis]|uniref:hypothetical protein n=1 Tax=Telluria beijingensis TaxID=3068633 RepID=UPI002795211F|nr:hypothetical protein [Massilia sp. REN29]
MSVHAGSIWIDNHLQNVPRDLWVAVDAQRLVGESQRYDDLVAYLVRQQIPLSSITIAYLPTGILQ